MRADGVELRWPGKYGPDGARAPIPDLGARLVVDARYGPSPAAPAPDRLVLGDNLAAMGALLADHEGAVDLIYIDPPFATGLAFTRALPRAPGEAPARAPAFDDRWQGGVGGYLAMLDPRLRLCRRLLAPHGSLYVHVDPTVGHAVKLLLDEIFGPECFQREIIWRIGWISGFKTRARNWIRNHDTLFFYTRDPARFTFHKHRVPYPQGYRRRDGKAPEGDGVPLDDVWNAGPADLALRGRDSLDSIQIKSFSREKTGWATQKSESLLRRIIAASSSPGDLVADLFCGSGTTLAVAAALGRRFLGCDRSPAAVHLAARRLRAAGVAFERCSLAVPAPAPDSPAPALSPAPAPDSPAPAPDSPAPDSPAPSTDSHAPENIIDPTGAFLPVGEDTLDPWPLPPRVALRWRPAGPWSVEVELLAADLAALDAWELGLAGAPGAPFVPAVELCRAAPRRDLAVAARLEIPVVAAPAEVAVEVRVVDLHGRLYARRDRLRLSPAGDLLGHAPDHRPGG